MSNIIDPANLRMFDPDKKNSIWDPNSEFMKELELYKLRSEIKPRKVNVMLSQVGMIDDMMSEEGTKRLYVPMEKGFVK